jgi:hypothetical protein
LTQKILGKGQVLGQKTYIFVYKKSVFLTFLADSKVFGPNPGQGHLEKSQKKSAGA